MSGEQRYGSAVEIIRGTQCNVHDHTYIVYPVRAGSGLWKFHVGLKRSIGTQTTDVHSLEIPKSGCRQCGKGLCSWSRIWSAGSLRSKAFKVRNWGIRRATWTTDLPRSVRHKHVR